MQLLTIPNSITDVDQVWVQHVLEHCGIDAEVASLDVQPIGTGQMATSVRAEITYASTPDRTNNVGAPGSFVVKFASADTSSRETGAQGAYLKEVRYYQEIDTTVDVATPQCLWANIDLDTSAFGLVLQDMTPALQGDQIAGCSVENARDAARNIAGLHAPRWGDESLFDVAWLTPSRADRPQTFAFAHALMSELTPAFIERYRDRLTDRHRSLLSWFVTNIETWLHLQPDVFSLTHADHRLDNLLFGSDASQPVTVVDWQTVGVRNPVADVSYLLGTGLTSDERRSAEQDLVGEYHNRLVAYGVPDYTFSDCFEDYVAQSFHAFLITVLGSMLTGKTARGDDMFMAMLHRSATQIDDLDATDCV